MRRRYAASGAIIAVGVTLLIASLSRVPYSAEADGDALIRLSWRARGERVRECRQLTEQERRQLPRHMKRTEVCEGRVSPYALRVVLDGATSVVDTIRASGAKQDRPLYVYRELRLPPGSHRLAITFQRIGSHDEQPTDERAVPPRLGLDVPVQLAPRGVALVTYDADARRLVLRLAADERSRR